MGQSSTFEFVHRSVKRGEIAPIYYLTGDADVLKDDLVAMIVDAALESTARDFNLDVRAAGDLDAAALHTLVGTFPVLAERRGVVAGARGGSDRAHGAIRGTGSRAPGHRVGEARRSGRRRAARDARRSGATGGREPRGNDRRLGRRGG